MTPAGAAPIEVQPTILLGIFSGCAGIDDDRDSCHTTVPDPNTPCTQKRDYQPPMLGKVPLDQPILAHRHPSARPTLSET